MRRILVLIAITSGLSMARGLVLSDWSALPGYLVGHTVTLTTHEGVELRGTLLENKPGAFTINVSRSTDATRFPRGKQVVPQARVSEVSGSERKLSFREFANGAFLAPLDNAVHANGLFTALTPGEATPLPLKAIDTLSIPFWLGWAGVGAAITPIAMPIGYLRGSTHFTYIVR